MLTEQKIIHLFKELNRRLETEGERAEVGIVGGTVMCLVFKARNATKDVDAIFEPTKTVRRLAALVGRDEGVGEDWLNDAVKRYIRGDFEKRDVFNFSHLSVWAPAPEYMLAMKCISARWDTHDKDDVMFLIRLLGVTAPRQVFALIEKYYPKEQVPAKTQFLIEELFEAKA